MEPSFIERFQGIEFEIQWSKSSPRVPRLRERREGNNVRERKKEIATCGQRQNEQKNINRGRKRMLLLVFSRL